MNLHRSRNETHLAADRAGWVRRYRTSGLSLKGFAAEHGLRPGQLHYWAYGPRSSLAAAAPTPPVFQEIPVPPEWTRPSTWMAEIGLPDGTAVRLAGRVDVAWASSLVESLRRPCSR